MILRRNYGIWCLQLAYFWRSENTVIEMPYARVTNDKVVSPIFCFAWAFFRGEEKSQRRCVEWTLSDAQSPIQKSLDSVIWATANACTITSPNIWPENEISCHNFLFLHWPQWWRSEQNNNPYSITERRVLELIPVLVSQPAGDVSHKPGGRLPLLSARPAVTLATLKRAATNFAAWWTEARRVWTVCPRLLPDSVAGCDLNLGLLRLSPAR